MSDSPRCCISRRTSKSSPWKGFSEPHVRHSTRGKERLSTDYSERYMTDFRGRRRKVKAKGWAHLGKGRRSLATLLAMGSRNEPIRRCPWTPPSSSAGAVSLPTRQLGGYRPCHNPKP